MQVKGKTGTFFEEICVEWDILNELLWCSANSYLTSVLFAAPSGTVSVDFFFLL